ncbi:hypothetical protein IJG72_07890 [bacterium]|nr:hypothetical protein [bacterium]
MEFKNAEEKIKKFIEQAETKIEKRILEVQNTTFEFSDESNSISKSEIYEYLKNLEILLEKSFPILSNNLVIIKPKEVETIIDGLYSAIPKEIMEARKLIRKKEEFQIKAKEKAERIILEAQNQANTLLNELKVIKEQIIDECKNT